MGLRQVVRGALNRLGYDVMKLRYRTHVHLREVLHEASVLDPRTVIDVGVAYGTDDLYAAFPRARHLLIEPVTEWEPVLQSIAEHYSAEYVVAAAGATPGEMTINVPEVYSWAGASSAGEPRTVPVVTVDEEVAQRGLVGPFVLKVDVEGAEASVLAGAERTLCEAELVILEVGVGGNFEELVAFMSAHGFVVHDVFGMHYTPADHLLIQADVAFVPNGSPLRAASYDDEDGLEELQRSFVADQQRLIRNAE